MGSDLIRALESENETEAIRLIEEGADASVQYFNGELPMNLAARMGSEKVIQLLIEKGYKYQLNSTLERRSPLIDAVEFDNESTVELLIKLGCDVNTVEMLPGWNPLRMAAFNNNKKIVKLLLKNGADIHAKNYMGTTARHIAEAWGYYGIAGLIEAWDHD